MATGKDLRRIALSVLGDRVRAALRHQGSWPKVSVWHGSADPLVKPSNAEDIVRQWANVHGISGRASNEETVAGHLRRVWNDASGNTIIEVFSINGMAHGVPLATGKRGEGCGAPGLRKITFICYFHSLRAVFATSRRPRPTG